MKITSEILKETAEYVKTYLAAHLPSQFNYHNIDHTLTVVNNTEILCDELKVNGRKKKALLTAAWFHDLGYTVQAEDHEKFGAQLAEEFLLKHGVDAETVELVKSLVLSTKYPQHPTNKLEKILCDADMLHLANADFLTKSELLRKEWSESKARHYSDAEWYQLNFDFLTGHIFHTRYAEQEFGKGQRKNAEMLERLIQSHKNQKPTMLAKAKKVKTSKLVKGVETLFRNSSRNHMELSAMADNKAHILLSVSSLIVSILISFMLQQLSTSRYLIIPTSLLLLVCLATIVLAVLTTKPKVSKGVFTVEQINQRNVNLLFFGNFHKMDINMYEWGVNEMIHDKEYLYNSMTKDIFYLGKVLAVKYRYLSIGYRVFMYGIIASVLAFSISFLFIG